MSGGKFVQLIFDCHHRNLALGVRRKRTGEHTSYKYPDVSYIYKIQAKF